MKKIFAVLLVLTVSSQSFAQNTISDQAFEREQKVIGYGLGFSYSATFTEDCELLIFDKQKSKLYRIPAASIDIDITLKQMR